MNQFYLKRIPYYQVFSDIIDKYYSIMQTKVALDKKSETKLDLFYDFQQEVFSFNSEPRPNSMRMKFFFKNNENEKLINETKIMNDEFLLHLINTIKEEKHYTIGLFKNKILDYFEENKNIPLYFLNFLVLDQGKVIEEYKNIFKKLEQAYAECKDDIPLQRNTFLMKNINETIKFIGSNAIFINEYLMNGKDTNEIFWFKFEEPDFNGLNLEPLEKYCKREELLKLAKLEFAKNLLLNYKEI